MSADRAVAMQRLLERNVAEGAFGFPPVAGVTYVACAVYGPGSADRLLAFAIGHLDDDQIVLDLLESDVSEAAAAAAVKRYRVSPANYLVDPLGRSLDGAEVPLAQAYVRIDELLHPKPKPTPSYLRTWRHQLLWQRANEVGDALQRQWRKCWKDGKQVAELPFDGGRVEELLHLAGDCHYADELDREEKLLEEAERVIIGRRRSGKSMDLALMAISERADR